MRLCVVASYALFANGANAIRTLMDEVRSVVEKNKNMDKKILKMVIADNQVEVLLLFRYFTVLITAMEHSTEK